MKFCRAFMAIDEEHVGVSAWYSPPVLKEFIEEAKADGAVLLHIEYQEVQSSGEQVEV